MDNFRDSYFNVTWDLTKKHLRGTFWGKQYDTGRGFAVTIVEGGQVTVPTTETVRLKWEKPDSTEGYVTAVVVDDKFLIEDIDQMFTVQGAVRSDLEIWRGGKVISSITFYVSVEKAVAVDAIESSSQFTALQEALADVGDMQAQVDAVIANATVDSEVILARGTEPTLGARLDGNDAQLAEIATEVDTNLSWQSVENIVTNDFDVNTSGWVVNAVAPSGVSASNVKVGTGSLYIKQTAQTARYDWLLSIPVGHKVYISSWVYLIEKPTVGYLPRLIRTSGTPIAIIPINDLSLNAWQRASVIGVMEEGARIRIGTNGAATGEYYTDGIVAIDLTAEFGVGNEPTAEEMDELLSRYENSFIYGKKAIKTLKEYIIEHEHVLENPDFTPNVTRPNGIIVPDFVEYAEKTLPFSVGIDDALYGVINRKIFKSEDGLATTIGGFDFTTIKPPDVTWEIRHVTRTHSGYVVVNNEVYGTASFRVFFSESFTGGFTEVYSASDRFWDVNFHNGDLLSQFGFVCGYSGTLNNSFGIHMTKDGGQTWSKVYSTVVVNSSYVAHVHTAQYDPYSGNIFASIGDGDDNRKFIMSENLGLTWEIIPTPLNEFGWTHLHQPTVVIPCRDKIVLGPDGAPSPCLYSITRDKAVKSTNTYQWGFKFELGISDLANTAQWYPLPVYGATKDRNEIYAIFPQNTPRENYFIVGTGDSGESWHIVYSLKITGVPTFDMNKGVIGVDGTGHFYAYVFDGAKHYIAKFKTPTWVLS